MIVSTAEICKQCIFWSYTLMIDWKQISGFEWDTGNARKSNERHNVTQGEAEEVFFNQPLLILVDTKHSQKEIRFHTLGKTDNNRLLHITFTLRSTNTLIRVISARDMHRKERTCYEKSQKDSEI